jgi:rare lipoprotein A
MRRRASHSVRSVVALIFLSMLGGCFHHAPTRSPSSPSAAPQSSKPTRSGRYDQDQDSSPQGPLPDVSKIPEPIPKAEPPSVYGNKSPYSVLGETYKILPNTNGYVERGIASWYGNKFHGHMTSIFEPYDMYAYTAAHKTLPLPCYARVTNLENGASVIVRINDRGPFAENRIIDLSYVAAVKLGIWQKGTGLVEVRAIDPAHPDLAKAPEPARAKAVSTRNVSSAVPPKTPNPTIYLQIGAFGEAVNAEHAASAVRAAHLGDVRIVQAQVNGKTIRRVQIGPLRDVDEADRLTPKLRDLGLGTPHVAVED